LRCAQSAVALPAQTFTTLFSFGGTDGGSPEAVLVQGTDGNFHGTTYDGTVFKITPGGTLTTLYTFCVLIPSCPDGIQPLAGTVQATNGYFYGTTSNAGPMAAMAPSSKLPRAAR
jgi:hypothetical protein